jgi:hypothetical protein
MSAVACSDDGGGPGVTSSSEHVEGTLPLADTSCFSQPLLDVLPNTAGDQFDCTATLDGNVLPACGSNEPCWEIVASTNVTCTKAPAVRGGTDGQLFAIDCIVEE